MDRLLPVPPRADLPLDTLYRDLDLPAGDDTRAGITLGMVASVDGATAVDGVSGGLGGAADAVAFGRLRGACDALLVGAGTVRDEGYGPPGGDNDRRTRRIAAGRRPVPALIVVTGSAGLDPDARLFTDARRDPSAPIVVATTEAAPPERRRALAEVAEVVTFGRDTVDLGALSRWCAEQGYRQVVCEGGPGLNGQLLAADLVDEVVMTLAPQLVSGDAARVATGPVLETATALEPIEVHHHAGELLLRYRVVR